MDDEMSKKKLIEYLPPFMQQFREIKEIMGTEEPEFDMVDGNIQRILDNGFIRDCNEFGIQKYENILGIIPEAGDCLELRKSRVLIEWNYSTPYTYRTLIRKMNAICGVNNYTVSGNLENYELIVSTQLSSNGQIEELEKMLGKILPMNISVLATNNLKHELEGAATMAGTLLKRTTVTISADMGKVVLLNSKITDGSVVASRTWRTIK